MQFFPFHLERPVLFYKGGEFSCTEPWRHRAVYHRGDYEIMFCIKGPFYLTVGKEDYTIGAGDVFVVPPFTRLEGSRMSQKPVDFFWLHFFSQHEEVPFTTDSELGDILRLLEASSQQIVLPMQFQAPDRHRLLVGLHEILAERCTSNVEFGLDECDYLTSALLIELFKSYANVHRTIEDDRMSYLQEWIRANMSATLSVAEIARTAHLNVDYLTRLFNRSTGMTTLRYINHLKIEVAEVLLVHTEMTIKEVARASYFNDPKVFMRHFRTATGLSPSEYRKTNSRVHLNNPHVDPQIPLPKRISDKIGYIPENGDIPE
ncbi:transcriptional regulator, AraC family [Coriobacterium glomerans PW2]|uniref:Transcriptional regulator, AraC family n=1 Tax=Coriobacterium glomerans (strain ATCC 49209 / DSM 20642 / JCM 10262 / PW2) TaxID=700015 RepID=F2N7D8_CORGP|nr:helix-turn-helix domain-containing protein [Coriobacterium glomerans]AEB06613.1 transcriptional regulator, AraC family [Coriobacterium glomerans PW2]